MRSVKAATSHVLLVTLVVAVSLAEAKFYRPVQYNLYKSGPSQHHQPAPSARHKNHCAYVVEKTMTYTVQAGAAPVVKAEYNKCAWGKKCPALQYRLMYKPMFKVAHKSVTELEWRCCPGYSGYGCMEGHYQHSMKALPPFKGPQQHFKGPPPVMHKGPMYKGPPMMKGPVYNKGPPPMMKGPVYNKGPPPMMKGPVYNKGPAPMMKGPVYNKGPPRPVQHNVKSMPWSGNHGNGGAHGVPPMMHGGGGGSYPAAGRHFGPHVPSPSSSSPDPDSQFEEYPSLEPEFEYPTEPEHLQEPQHHEHQQVHEQQQAHVDEHAHEHHGGGGEPEEHVPGETAPPARGDGGEDTEGGQAVDSETEERLGRMEDDVRRLNLGLETLRGTVDGLEDGLRASLREDANRMLSALLSAAPGGPLLAASSALRGASPGGGHHATVGFGDIPGGEIPEGDMDARPAGMLAEGLPGLGELNSRLDSLRSELLTKAAELQELRATVMGHDGALSKLSGSSGVSVSGEDAQSAMERLVDARMGAARAEILAGLERRVESAEERCEDQLGELRRQCQRERGEGRSQMEEELSGSTSHLRRDLASMQAQIHSVEAADSCCGRTSGLDERVSLLEQSVSGLNQSQLHLAKEMGGHKDHMEGMVAGRLEYVEAMLNLTEVMEASGGAPGGLEAHLDGKLRALEGRLLTAVEELVANGGNATTLEGHAVMPTDLESLRGRLEMDVERVQKHLSDLETRCLAHSASDVQADQVSGEVDENARMALDAHAVRLNSLNDTLQALLNQRALRGLPEGQEGDPSVLGELTILRFDIQSVNASLTGLAGSVGTVAQHMDRVNNTWTEREGRLAHQMRGVVQLVGRQASMLGAGDRRLSRLKGELAGMKRRLAGEVQGCRTTALGVLQEVEEVGGRVSSVEDQCKGLKDMEAHLERVRVELEGQADSLLSLVNGTLSSHAQQLSELRTGLLSCGANNNNNNNNNNDDDDNNDENNGTAPSTTRPEPTQDTTALPPICTDGGTTGPAPEPTQDTVLPLNGTTGGTTGPEPTQDTVLPLNGTTGGTTGPEPTQDTVLPLNGTTGGTTGPEPTQDTVLPLNGTTGTSGPEPTQDTILPLNGTTDTTEPEPIQNPEVYGVLDGSVVPPNGTILNPEVVPVNSTTNGTSGQAEPEPFQKNPEVVYGVLDGSVVPMNGTNTTTTTGPEPELTLQQHPVPLIGTITGPGEPAEPNYNPVVLYGVLDGSVVPAGQPTQQDTAVPPPPQETRGDTFTLI